MAKKDKKATAAAPAAGVAAVAYNMALLATLVSVTQQGQFIFTTDAQCAQLNTAWFIRNTDMGDGQGGFATKATDAGIAALQPQTASAATTAASEDEGPLFEIFENVALPQAKRFGSGNGGRPRGSRYRFDDMPVNSVFFVPKSDKMADPAKSLASVVSSASRRFSTEQKDAAGNVVTKMRAVAVKDANGDAVQKDGKTVTEQKAFPVRVYERKFEIRAVEDGATLGPQFAKYKGIPGAAIGRVK